MRICTLVSTRPELIRLSRIIDKIDRNCYFHKLIYSSQNFDPKLSTIFFQELGIRTPDLIINNKSESFGEQIGLMFTEVEKYLKLERPDKLLILGDTNGCLCAIIAKRLGISVFHLEAGNRAGEWINEEINRHLIDSISDFHLPYTEGSKENLIAEGVSNKNIFVIGNPIAEVLDYYKDTINTRNILTRLQLTEQNYFLASFHRHENVTNGGVLYDIVEGLKLISKGYNLPIICSIHPKTRTNLEKFGINEENNIRFLEPLGFFDFVHLEKHAKCIISDSGTCPEEGNILGVPSVIIRNKTERPELLQCGSSFLSGTDKHNIFRGVEIMLENNKTWEIPQEYKVLDVSDRVVKILLGRT